MLLLNRFTNSSKLPCYGMLKGILTISQDGIRVNEMFYPYGEIQDFDMKLVEQGLKMIPSSLRNPGHHHGTDNHLYFRAGKEIVQLQICLRAGTEFDTIHAIVDRAITDGQLRFRQSYLNLISRSYQQKAEYRQFLKKLKHKNP